VVGSLKVDRSVAENAVGIILDFLASEGPPDKVRVLLERIPGADAAIESARSRFGGDPGMSGLMGVGSRLMAAGVGMNEMQGITRELIDYSREKAGDAATSEVLAAIPGLGQFI
jgi:hypothetical protein